MPRSRCETRSEMIETIECPYCHKAQAVKLWRTNGPAWDDTASTDPNDRDCTCNVYVCPSCGRVAILYAEVMPDAERRD